MREIEAVRFRGESLLCDLSVLTGFAAPTGQLDAVGKGLYRTAALVLQGSPDLYVFADQVSIGERDEIYPLGCREFDERRDWSRPGFLPVEPTLPDLALPGFLDVPLRTSLLTTLEAYYVQGVPTQVPVDSGIVFESPMGRQLLVESCHHSVDGRSPVSPLDLTLASEPGVIRERLARGEMRRASESASE
jgi:hypothetical protein